MLDETSLTTIVVVILIACVVGAYFLRRRGVKASRVTLLPMHWDSAPKKVSRAIAIGENPERPLVTITDFRGDSEFEIAHPISESESGPINRLNALIQAVPGALVSGEASGKRIMEVVVNGDLVRAADGKGMRAFVMGSEGIKENARLFEAQNFHSLINAAAVWQIASVVVAQKHLADISVKLDEIKSEVSGISKFLDSQRRSQITSASEYLGQVYVAIQEGELPETSKSLFNDCERELLQVQDHLVAEYRDCLSEKPKNSDTFGSEGVANNIRKKLQKIDALSEDIALCIKTRMLCWYVFSLYPGDPKLKSARRDSILRAIDSYEYLGKEFRERMHADIEAIDAFWNTEETLRTRKAALHAQSESYLVKLDKKSVESRYGVESSNQFLLESGKPTRLLFQYENEKLIGVRRPVR